MTEDTPMDEENQVERAEDREVLGEEVEREKKEENSKDKPGIDDEQQSAFENNASKVEHDVEAQQDTEDDGTSPKPEPRWPFPQAFYDPVTKRIMLEPVVHPDGNSYEKDQALARDNSVVYYPNRALQAYIEQELDRFGDAGTVRGMVQDWGESLRSGWQKLIEKSALPQGEYRPLPDSFYCPISFDLINIPVIDPDGHTYEKAAIEHWLRANGESPVTRKPLTVDQLYDNKALLSVVQFLTEEKTEDVHPSIRRWKEEHSSRLLVSPIVPTEEQMTESRQESYPTTQAELDELNRQRRQNSCTLCGFMLMFVIVIFFAPSYFLCFFLIFMIVWSLHAPYRQRQLYLRRQMIRNQAIQEMERQQQERREQLQQQGQQQRQQREQQQE